MADPVEIDPEQMSHKIRLGDIIPRPVGFFPHIEPYDGMSGYNQLAWTPPHVASLEAGSAGTLAPREPYTLPLSE